MPLDTEQLAGEARIVWLEDISGLPYVREWLVATPHRSGQPAWQGLEGRLVGYAELQPNAPRGAFGFARRVFFLKDYDRDRAPAGIYHAAWTPGAACGGCPMEGVDPHTVAPGVPGVQNERAWGGPLPG